MRDKETVVKSLEKKKDWYAVRHGRKFEWSKSMFRFELLRKLVLTNQRIVFLKDEEIDYEIPLEAIKGAVLDIVGFAGNPYLRLELEGDNYVSIFFSCVGVRSLMGIFLLSQQRELTKKWIDAINNQLSIILKKKSLIKKVEDPFRILQIRYAKGEITKEQYEEMKKTLDS